MVESDFTYQRKYLSVLRKVDILNKTVNYSAAQQSIQHLSQYLQILTCEVVWHTGKSVVHSWSEGKKWMNFGQKPGQILISNFSLILT